MKSFYFAFVLLMGVQTFGLSASVDWPLNYQSLKANILDVRCVKCHCPDDSCAADTVLFEPYTNITQDPQQKWSAPAAQSRIIRALTRTDKHRMPPPKDSDALPQDQIDFISQWIDAGKPEQ